MHLHIVMGSKATQWSYEVREDNIASPLFSVKLQMHSKLLPTSVICQHDFVLQKAETEMGRNTVIFHMVFILLFIWSLCYVASFILSIFIH